MSTLQKLQLIAYWAGFDWLYNRIVLTKTEERVLKTGRSLHAGSVPSRRRIAEDGGGKSCHQNKTGI